MCTSILMNHKSYSLQGLVQKIIFPINLSYNTINQLLILCTKMCKTVKEPETTSRHSLFCLTKQAWFDSVNNNIKPKQKNVIFEKLKTAYVRCLKSMIDYHSC